MAILRPILPYKVDKTDDLDRFHQLYQANFHKKGRVSVPLTWGICLFQVPASEKEAADGRGRAGTRESGVNREVVSWPGDRRVL